MEASPTDALVSIAMPNVIHDFDKSFKIQAIKIIRIRKVCGEDAGKGRCREFHGGPRMAPDSLKLGKRKPIPRFVARKLTPGAA